MPYVNTGLNPNGIIPANTSDNIVTENLQVYLNVRVNDVYPGTQASICIDLQDYVRVL